ncbi:beta-alanine transporter-like isoform X2 [Tachypleus tridentatus]|uniref:beta-alanine transporter-like isoform X2 n=1 Tax=Tachypleus tridentatus TaxID=6853 RepID=UPI003FD34681
MTFETNVLSKVGDFGPFQKRLCILLAGVLSPTLAAIYYSQILITITPDHWCMVPELDTIPLEARLELAIPRVDKDGIIKFSSCEMYDVNFTSIVLTAPLRNNSKIILVANTNWPKCSCKNGHEFDTQTYHKTVSSEQSWVCDNDWKLLVAQVAFFSSTVLGSLIYGLVADWHGRTFSLRIGCIVCGISCFVSSFFLDFYSFVALRIFLGAGLQINRFLSSLLVIEYLGPRHRSFVAQLATIQWGFVGAIFPWLAFWLGDWKWLSMGTSVSLMTVVIVTWWLPESAHWMLVNKQTVRLLHTLEHVAKVNGKSVTKEILLETIEAANEEETQKKRGHYLDLFKTPNLRKRTVIVCWLCLLGRLGWTFLYQQAQNMGSDFKISMSMAAAVEIPAILIARPIVDRIGRRWTCFLVFQAQSVFLLTIPAVPTGYPNIVLALSLAGRFVGACGSHVALPVYATELFPTMLRAQANSLRLLLGGFGMLLSPFLMHLPRSVKRTEDVIPKRLGSITTALELTLSHLFMHCLTAARLNSVVYIS